MKRIADTGGGGLLWHQPDFTGANQVLFDGEVVATLQTVGGKRGLQALAEAAEDRWEFQADGLFRRYLGISSGGAEVARFRESTGADAGVLEFPPGTEAYRWRRLGRPLLHWTWTDRTGIPALDFQTPPRTDVSSRALSARIDVNPAVLVRPEIPLLILLSGFLMIRGDGSPALRVEDMERKLGTKEIYGI